MRAKSKRATVPARRTRVLEQFQHGDLVFFHMPGSDVERGQSLMSWFGGLSEEYADSSHVGIVCVEPDGSRHMVSAQLFMNIDALDDAGRPVSVPANLSKVVKQPLSLECFTGVKAFSIFPTAEVFQYRARQGEGGLEHEAAKAAGKAVARVVVDRMLAQLGKPYHVGRVYNTGLAATFFAGSRKTAAQEVTAEEGWICSHLAMYALNEVMADERKDASFKAHPSVHELHQYCQALYADAFALPLKPDGTHAELPQVKTADVRACFVKPTTHDLALSGLLGGSARIAAAAKEAQRLAAAKWRADQLRRLDHTMKRLAKVQEKDAPSPVSTISVLSASPEADSLPSTPISGRDSAGMFAGSPARMSDTPPAVAERIEGHKSGDAIAIPAFGPV